MSRKLSNTVTRVLSVFRYSTTPSQRSTYASRARELGWGPNDTLTASSSSSVASTGRTIDRRHPSRQPWTQTGCSYGIHCSLSRPIPTASRRSLWYWLATTGVYVHTDCRQGNHSSHFIEAVPPRPTQVERIQPPSPTRTRPTPNYTSKPWSPPTMRSANPWVQ